MLFIPWYCIGTFFFASSLKFIRDDAFVHFYFSISRRLNAASWAKLDGKSPLIKLVLLLKIPLNIPEFDSNSSHKTNAVLKLASNSFIVIKSHFVGLIRKSNEESFFRIGRAKTQLAYQMMIYKSESAINSSWPMGKWGCYTYLAPWWEPN